MGLSNRVSSNRRLVGLVHGGTFFRGTNVNFVELESSNLLVDHSQEPGAGADTSGLQEQAPTKKHVYQRVGQELKREGSSNQLPGDGSKDGGDDSTQETHVEEFLDGVRDTEDVSVDTNLNVQGSDTGNDKEAKSDTHLTANHESRKVTSFSAEQKLAGLHGHGVGSAFALWKLRDGEEGNLHTLQHTDERHEHEEQDNGNTIWHRVPHGSLSIEEGLQSNRKAERKDGDGPQASSPEEEGLRRTARLLIGNNGLSGEPVEEVLNEVGSVHDTSLLNKESNPESESHEVVFDVIKHAVGSIDLHCKRDERRRMRSWRK